MTSVVVSRPRRANTRTATADTATALWRRVHFTPLSHSDGGRA
jgi:hypothetical protein